MLIKTYNYDGEPNRVNKTLQENEEYTGVLNSTVNILEPVIRFRTTNIVTFNYVYIESLNRYYFVSEIRQDGDICTVYLRTDVLMTYEDKILDSVGTLVKGENGNKYLSNRSNVFDVRPNIKKVDFPNKNLLNSDGQIIMVTIKGTTENPYSFVSKYGYKFTGETKPKIRRKNASGEFYDSNLPATITLRTLNVTNNIPNSTVEYEQISETRFNFTLTCANGFTGTPQITYTDDYGSERTKEMNVSGNVATITVDIDSYTDDVTFSYNQVEPQNIPVTYDLTNCEVIGDKPDSIALNETLTVTIQANENATLETLQIVYNDSYGAEKTVDGEINETGKTGTVSFTPTSTDIAYIEVRATATADEPTLKGYGAINVYKVTLENLDEFAQKRFFTATDGTNALVNLGDYVNRIKRVFVDVPTSGNDTLKCGNYNTEISVLSPNTDVVTVDFGNVTLTGENENSHDYETKIKLFLPFYGFVDINSSYINREINLTAKINIITGNGIMQISCDGIPFHFENVSFSRDVIYRTANESLKLVGDDDFNELNLYGFEPYFIVESTTTVNVPINDTKEQKRIGDVTGFSQFENVSLSTNNTMLADEFNEIVSQLENGVYL